MKGKVLTIWSLIWLLATVFFAVGGAQNLLQRSTKEFPPTDGIIWTQKDDGIYAEKIQSDLAGARAGIIEGDKLIGISLDEKKFEEIVSPVDIQEYLEAAKVGGNLTYYYQRPSYKFKDNFYYADLHKLDTKPRWTPSIILLTIVGFIWLAVGFFVLLKQGGNSPFVLHFATLCLAAFVFQTYKPIGTGEDFDLAVTILDDLAFISFPAIFLHFCWRYPTRSSVFGEKRWRTFLLYTPAALLFLATLACYISFRAEFMIEWAKLINKFDILGKLYILGFVNFCAGISIGAVVLIWRFFNNKQTVVRQRLKWTIWGTVLAIFPILAVQLVKRFIYLPEDIFTASVTTLPLALIPLSFGHSVVRYRLMDVDVMVRRVFVYAMTTIAIAMLIGLIALGVVFVASGKEYLTAEYLLRGLIAVVAMAAIVLLSEPLKNFLQERADRFFYGERYDLRHGLLDFGRTLSATTGLDPLLSALVDRLKQVLAVEKVAVFIEDDKAFGGYRIAKSAGLSSTYLVSADFRQMIRQKSAQKGIVRADELEALDETSDGQNFIRQELHYYAPCVVRGRMVAVIGLGRAVDGSLLSSEDLDILQTVSGYVAVAVENTSLYEEQAKRADELALLKDFNESIVESVNVGLLAVDGNGYVTRCNSTFEEMLELSREQVVGKLVINLFDENFSANLLQILGKSRWHLQELRHAYKVHTTSSTGKSLIINAAVAPLRTISQGQQTGAIIVLENVTSRIKLEETLQQSEKLSSIGLLAAGVAHEVNTPLTGVSSYTQMLLGMIPETDPKHALLLKVQKQTERASNIASNLLNFSRVGSATDFIEIDINKILNDTLQLLEIQLRKSNVEVVKNYSEPLPKIYGNPGKLQQVFTNLVLNARDAMFESGRIILMTKLENEDSVVIEISDNGTGIEPEDLGKIFDPFFTTKGVGSGTGLGLAVTYGIVQEHSGTIEASSELGEGTTFRLEFPVAQKRRKRAVS